MSLQYSWLLKKYFPRDIFFSFRFFGITIILNNTESYQLKTAMWIIRGKSFPSNYSYLPFPLCIFIMLYPETRFDQILQTEILSYQCNLSSAFLAKISLHKTTNSLSCYCPNKISAFFYPGFLLFIYIYFSCLLSYQVFCCLIIYLWNTWILFWITCFYLLGIFQFLLFRFSRV